MDGRLAHVGAAAAAALLGAAALRTVHAEMAYDQGLAYARDAETGPAADLPGRLEAYDEACRRDEGEALYALRAAQIRLFRAAPRSGPADPAELTAARSLLDRARRLRPLDSKVRATCSQLERAAGNLPAAVDEAWLAVLTAPRGPGALRNAVAVGLAAWRAGREPSHLRLALTGGRGLERIDPAQRSPALDVAFAEAGGALAGDLLEATSGDADLRGYAARRVRAARPALAEMLDETPAAGGR